MTDVTWIVLGFVFIAIGAYFSFVKPWLASKLSADQLTLLNNLAKVAVQAAEQIINIVTGKDKKTFAMDYIKALLAKMHLTFDENAISAAIESQVYEMNKDKEKKLPSGDAE